MGNIAVSDDPTTFREVRRRLADAFDTRPSSSDGDGPTLETRRSDSEPPRLAQVTIIEGASIARREIPDEPVVGFGAFLDGTQATRVLRYDGAVPIVHGAVDAVVRHREDRRLSTWKYAAESQVYAPISLLSDSGRAALAASGVTAIDITPHLSDGSVDAAAMHPALLSDHAVHSVQVHRERLERQLAESWADDRADELLYVDGGISGSSRLSSSSNVVGVVKSHRTLYGDPASVRIVLALSVGERSTAFAIEPRGRSRVASWYLRLRDSAGRDPLWGMVRVEIAPPAENLSARADLISRWILAESTPLSLPDSRWDTMVYGIRDCEQFLRSRH